MARLELFTPPVFFAQDATPGGTNEPEQQPDRDADARDLLQRLKEAFEKAAQQPPSPKEPPANP